MRFVTTTTLRVSLHPIRCRATNILRTFLNPQSRLMCGAIGLRVPFQSIYKFAAAERSAWHLAFHLDVIWRIASRVFPPPTRNARAALKAISGPFVPACFAHECVASHAIKDECCEGGDAVICWMYIQQNNWCRGAWRVGMSSQIETIRV